MEKGPSNFSPEGEASDVAIRWEEWLEEFQSFADSKGLLDMEGTSDKVKQSRAQRKALLLYHAGPGVRSLVKSFETTERDDYQGLVQKLNAHFAVEVNTTFQRHLFRKLCQNNQEPISQYVARLRKSAFSCGFGDHIDELIRDQIVECCISDRFRRKLLEAGNKLTLAVVLQEAATFEAVELRNKEISQSCQNAQEVNRLRTQFQNSSRPTSGNSQDVQYHQNHTASQTQRKHNTKDSGNTQCGRCGRDKSHSRCPALGKQCYKCNKDNHFKHMCRAVVKTVETHDDESAPTLDPSKANANFAFTLQVNACKLHRMNVDVGGIQVNFIIDTGADCNVIDRNTWESLKANGIKVSKSVKEGPNIYSYSSKTPLKVVGQFWAELKCEAGREVKDVRFLVIDAVADPLLGIESATKLDQVQFTNKTSTTLNYGQLGETHPKLFSGEIGRAKGEIDITIDHSVPAVAQPFRRVPFALRNKLEAHLLDLEQKGIIEKVSGPVTWASLVVIVPKPDTSIRLCVDMCQANEAVIRHNYPVPTVDELLLDMNGSPVFSKIDLKSGFHQFVLSENSRDITTFTTHVGLYRYTRLMFGISSAPEIYQSMVASIIRGIPRVVSLADDIVMHGKTVEEHDARLTAALQCLEKSGLTLNEKCCFGADSIDFLGHGLSSGVVKPGKDTVEAVLKATEPETVGDMKSLLGLTGYCSKFIPDYSSKTECLRALTLGMQATDRITLGEIEKKAFQLLKESLANADTLAYFDTEAETLLYVDASPVGLGLVLVQKQNGELRVICYASRAFTSVEEIYCQTKKEALAIVWACERLHHYLFGTRFTLLTDHEPLEVIYGNKKKKSSARIERWVLRLQSYDFAIKYVKGILNIADSLSRLLNDGSSAEGCGREGSPSLEDAELYVRGLVVDAVVDSSAVTARDIERASDSDSELSLLRTAIDSGNFEKVSRVFRAIKDELCVVGLLIMRGTRILVPSCLRGKLPDLGHEGHLGITGMKRNPRTRVWWPGIDLEAERYVRTCHGCQVTGEIPEKEPIRVTDLPNGP